MLPLFKVQTAVVADAPKTYYYYYSPPRLEGTLGPDPVVHAQQE
jgi:hypothetical protein